MSRPLHVCAFPYSEQIPLSVCLPCRRIRKGVAFFCNILHYHWSCQQDINSPEIATEPIELLRGITNALLSMASKSLSLFSKSLVITAESKIFSTIKWKSVSFLENLFCTTQNHRIRESWNP